MIDDKTAVKIWCRCQCGRFTWGDTTAPCLCQEKSGFSSFSYTGMFLGLFSHFDG